MADEVHAVFGLGRAGSIRRRVSSASFRQTTIRAVALACVIVLAALSSDSADWQPLTLVVALGVTMVIADILAVTARRIRVSAGLMVQVVAMALLGPAPAATIGIVAAVPDAAINGVRPASALNNMAVFGFLGLVGGCAGSTCCSVKIFRYQILFSAIAVQIRKIHSPHGVFVPRFDGRPVPEDVLS